MALLSGHSESPGARIPIRVERPSGAVAALTTTNSDGSWEVQVPPGDYVVIERYGTAYHASATESGQSAASGVTEYPPGSPGNSPRARRARGETS